MSKSSLFRLLVVALIVLAVAAAAFWVVANPDDINDQEQLSTSRPFTEKKETQSSLATLTIDARVKTGSILLEKLIASARPKMAEHAKYAAETWTLMGKGSQRQLGFEIDWSVTFENERLISLQESTYDNGGGAHPNSYLRSLLWDKRNKKAIGLADLLKGPSKNSAALEMISATLLDQWKAEFRERSNSQDINAYSLEWAQKGLAPKLDSFSAFVLTAEEGTKGAKASGLIFLFAPYTLSAYVFGSFSLEVPSSALQPYLAGEWKDEFK
ncbi:MAG: DUF3298 and DUF4163 domain-containing protein [Parvibaculaceae bacterium]|nr:DUF3298 and DUF4163 domain-containing protein [Parvibaculaceae bacterium]